MCYDRAGIVVSRVSGGVDDLLLGLSGSIEGGSCSARELHGKTPFRQQTILVLCFGWEVFSGPLRLEV